MATDLEKTIDDIQSKLDIAEVVNSYIPLKKAGRNFKACCPFHHEKTPSFVVSPQKQIFHCFGCGAGGDMITFVMKQEGLEFIEALKILAQKAHVSLPQFKGSTQGARRSFSQALSRINELACNYYSALLIGSKKSAHARSYLGKRSLNAQTVATFKLGFAPEGWDNLLKFAEEKGVKGSALEKAGLVLPGKESGFYDRFRNRIIFPIFDIRSKIVAFGGRVLDESMPKYMNSPETDAYVKGKHLYGLNFAIDEIRKKDYCIIVEGYLDLIIPYQNGIKNIAATLGTALTVEQIRLIKRFTNNVVIIFDADPAGEAASLRGLDLLLSEGLFVKIARLPEGDDPDSFVKREGKDNLVKLLEGADNLFDYKLKILLGKFNPAQAEDKSKISAEMLPTIKRVENDVLRSDYVKKLSETLFIGEDAILSELSKVKLDYTYLQENKTFKETASIRPAEKIVVGLMLEDPDIASAVKDSLSVGSFLSPQMRVIVKTVFDMLDKGDNPSAPKIIHKINNEDINHVVTEAIAETEKLDDRDRSLRDCVGCILKDNIKIRREQLTSQMKEAEAKGDEVKLMELVKQHNALRSVKF